MATQRPGQGNCANERPAWPCRACPHETAPSWQLCRFSPSILGCVRFPGSSRPAVGSERCAQIAAADATSGNEALGRGSRFRRRHFFARSSRLARWLPQDVSVARKAKAGVQARAGARNRRPARRLGIPHGAVSRRVLCAEGIGVAGLTTGMCPRVPMPRTPKNVDCGRHAFFGGGVHILIKMQLHRLHAPLRGDGVAGGGVAQGVPHETEPGTPQAPQEGSESWDPVGSGTLARNVPGRFSGFFPFSFLVAEIFIFRGGPQPSRGTGRACRRGFAGLARMSCGPEHAADVLVRYRPKMMLVQHMPQMMVDQHGPRTMMDQRKSLPFAVLRRIQRCVPWRPDAARAGINACVQGIGASRGKVHRSKPRAGVGSAVDVRGRHVDLAPMSLHPRWHRCCLPPRSPSKSMWPCAYVWV
jgi:hypothetical protein